MMATEVKLPNLGDNIEGADVLRVLVKVGDKVTAQTTVIELETDKATVENVDLATLYYVIQLSRRN